MKKDDIKTTASNVTDPECCGNSSSCSSSNSSSTDEEVKLKIKFNQTDEMLKKIKENKFDWALFKRFIKIIQILYWKPVTPLILFLILFGSGVAQTYVSKFTGILLANIYGSFTTGDKNLFLSSMLKGGFAIGGSAILDASIKLIVSLMAWNWRKSLCFYIQDVYFKKSLFYKILAFDDRIDNPDQRITSDIDNFTTLLASIVSQCITGPMVVVYYTYLCYTTIDWYAPLIVYGYFFLGYFINKLVMSPMVSINYLQDKLEGDFRYLHQRVRNFAESIAFHNLSKEKSVKIYDNDHDDDDEDSDEYTDETKIINRKKKGTQYYNKNPTPPNNKRSDIYYKRSKKKILKKEKELLVEEEQANSQFETLLKNKKRVIFWQFGLNTTSDLFTFFSPIANYFIIAIPLFFLNTKTVLDANQVTVQSYNCIMLASGFSQYINVSQNISDLSGYISRISTMIEVCKNVINDTSLDTEVTKLSEKDNIVTTTNSLNVNNIDTSINTCLRHISLNHGESITLDDVTYFTPKGTQLYSKISICIKKGKNLLIMGPSGSGKSSLIRVINGLWPFFKGSINRPENEDMFFLPQQPYLIFGTLEEQILYPFSKKQKRIPKSIMKQLFKRFEIDYLLDRERFIKNSAQINDLTHNWLNQLSPGEQQLIAIIRLIYHKPKFALMDESTSSIPQSIEERVYSVAKELDITTISVGHRISLLKYHSTLLRFDKDKNWHLEDIIDKDNNGPNKIAEDSVLD
ncbi:hypothetical protein RB653_005405 [Dictyostelium firmibasis]|uniref:Uncharacterized protein n=1 Tax=Dictyostelium firmibasis TaxID=79012 RepID=A0AAN7UKY9_9MYCE